MTRFFTECSSRKLSKIAIVLVILTFLVLAIVYNSTTKKVAEDFLEWIGDHPIEGALAFIAAYIITTVLFVPGTILTIGAGYIYAQVQGVAIGVLIATVVVFIGAFCGATLSFLIGRYVFGDLVEKWTAEYQQFSIVQKVIEAEGLKVSFLLRLSPLLPYNLLNYAFGLTTVSLRDYCLALFGMLPGTIAYTFIGSSVSSIQNIASASKDNGGTGLLVFIIVGTVLAVGGMIYVGILAKREINKISDRLDEGDEENKGDLVSYQQPIAESPEQ